MIPLAEIAAIVAREANYRRRLGRHNMMALCLQCPRSTCDTSSSQCLARQRTAEKWRECYRRNPEPHKARARARAKANPDQTREKNAAYRAECADALKVYRDRYREENRAAFNEYMREWKRAKRKRREQA